MTVLNNPHSHFSSQESLDSDVTPTALFRGNSFDTTSESEADGGIVVGNKGVADYLQQAQQQQQQAQQQQQVQQQQQSNLKSNVNHLNLQPTSKSTLSSSSSIHKKLHPNTYHHNNSNLKHFHSNHPNININPANPNANANQIQKSQQLQLQSLSHSQSQYDQERQRRGHQSPLSKCSAAEAANVLFPPPTPQSRSKSNSPKPQDNYFQNNHHNHHPNNGNIHSHIHRHSHSFNSSGISNTNMMNISNDNDTVVTEVMATTDEDSFDISPLPSSPVNAKSAAMAVATAKNMSMSMPPPVLPSSVSSGSSSSNSRKRTSSDRKKSKVRAHPHYSVSSSSSSHGLGHGLGHHSNLNLGSSITSSPLAFLSTGIQKDVAHAHGNVNGNGNVNGIMNQNMPPVLTRTMLSQPPPPPPPPSSSTLSSSLQPPSTIMKAKYQSLAFRSIQTSHSFDSYDSNTSYNSHNELLHLDTSNASGSNSNGTTHINYPPQSMDGSGASTNSNTSASGGWMLPSNFTFSGSPIEEEEPHHYEDDANVNQYPNDSISRQSRNRYLNQRHLYSPQSSPLASASTAIHHVHNHPKIVSFGDCEDQFSSKIRRLNLDCEMNGHTGAFAGGTDSNRNRTSSSGSCSIGGSPKNESGDANSTEVNRWNHSNTSNHNSNNNHNNIHRSTMGKSDSFRLHVTTDFNSPDPEQNGSNDSRNHNNKNANDDNDISPTDVMGFPYPSPSPALPLSSSASLMSTSTMKTVNHNQASSSSSSREDPLSFLPIKRNNISDNGYFYGHHNRNVNHQILNLNQHNHDDDNDDYYNNSNLGDNTILPPPNTFSSPPPLLKKGLHGPPSPCRMGRIGGKVLLPPTTPMVPQKAMRRMRGHDGINNGATPNSNVSIPLSGGSVGGDHRGRLMMNMNGNATSFEEASRFDTDFQIMGTLGKGSFGTVYKCRSRLDNRLYAVKAAKRRAKGRADRDRMLKEVYALAELSDLADTTAFHIVRYHQAWMEEDKLHIVTELCTSTLQIEMQNGIFHGNTKRLYKLLREMLLALRLIHVHGLVHLDIKPENIFVREDTFKLGDFGLVSKVSVEDDVEEGDSRYMCMDLLSGNHKDLRKCDIFSLGITMYEIVLDRALPLDGQEWQNLRAGKLNAIPHAQSDLQDIIKVMMHPDANQRPHAAELLKRRQLLSDEQKQLITEQNRVREATLALAYQEERFKKIKSPKRGLTRSNTCPR